MSSSDKSSDCSMSVVDIVKYIAFIYKNENPIWYSRNKFVLMPDYFPPQYNASREKCDMLVGFCICGAGHFIGEDRWILK